MESWKQDGHTYYRLTGPGAAELLINEFVFQDGEQPLHAWVTEEGRSHRHPRVTHRLLPPEEQRVGHHRAQPRTELRPQPVDGPDIDFITLLGQAGTGKTLLTLAASLTQVLETKRYSEIIMTRVTVPVGGDIGFLPGTEEEKMAPWMGRSRTTSTC